VSSFGPFCVIIIFFDYRFPCATILLPIIVIKRFTAFYIKIWCDFITTQSHTNAWMCQFGFKNCIYKRLYMTIINFSEQVGKKSEGNILNNSDILFTLIIIHFNFHHLNIVRLPENASWYIYHNDFIMLKICFHNTSPAESFRFAQLPGNRYFSLKYCITEILFLENRVPGNSTGDFAGISSTRAIIINNIKNKI